MGWGKRYPEEQMVARHALLSTAESVSLALSSFVGWLLTVSGASFTLLVANLDKIVPYVHLRSFKWALAWFAMSMLLGLLSRWLGSMVAGALAATSALEDQVRARDFPDSFNFLAFTKLFSIGLLPIYRCLAWRGYSLALCGNTISGIKPITYQSQTQALLTLGQLSLLFIAVVVLTHGVKV
ncbi:hypothetical protein [Stenotrophomonas acidaminiphila]|uniref:hypothetical protein n=1 Tax=Stenotrophomonas acidaminiphila TaxID=128780 RepID=UPI0028AA6394|nr:hypothetical protein [Stenotrophomonas acidaminiphila]